MFGLPPVRGSGRAAEFGGAAPSRLIIAAFGLSSIRQALRRRAQPARVAQLLGQPQAPDHDYQVSDTLRFVQLTPPGSACSIVLGTGITEMAPGSQKGVQMVVADAAAAREQLIARGVQASDVDVQPWGSFVFFSDPDGNTWSLQQPPAWQ